MNISENIYKNVRDIQTKVSLDTMYNLTLTLLNCLNGIIHLPFLEQSIIIFWDIKMRTFKWRANGIEPGQTAGLALFYTRHKALSTFGSSRKRVYLQKNLNNQRYK